MDSDHLEYMRRDDEMKAKKERERSECRMVTAHIRVDNKPMNREEILAYFELVWDDSATVNVHNVVELRLDMRPFYEGIAVSRGRKYVQSWAPVPGCVFLEIIGKYNREGKLLDVFFDDERDDDEHH